MRVFRPAHWFGLTLGVGGALACGSAETIDQKVTEPTCPELVVDSLLEVEGPPDGTEWCAAGDCNYQSQDGCAADEACRPQFNATDPKVAPGCEAAGAGESGDGCEAQTDCASGFYCARNVATEPGACRRFCCGGDWSACDEGESCIRSLSVKAGGMVLPAEVDLCFPVNDCDVFDPDACEDPARECKIVDPIGNVACAPRSNADVGDQCGPPDVCKQGLNCVGGFCVKLCRFEECGEPGCAADEGSCVHFERDPLGVGECSLGR